MANDPRDALVDEMETIRRQGLGAVGRVNQNVKRLTDWREHIRATPLPFVVAAAAVGYLLVPNRTSTAPLLPGKQILVTKNLSGPGIHTRAAGKILDRLRSTALTVASRWMQAAISDFVKHQMISVVEKEHDRVAESRRSHANRE